jgi:uncharacterized protein (DUF1330 family)
MRAYWISFYHSISRPDAFAAYTKLAWPAVAAGGGRFLARGNPARIYDAGLYQRVAVIEFDSVEHATATHESAAYQAALRAMDNGAVRDLRIVEGLL